MNPCKAFRVFQEGGRAQGRFTEMRLEELAPGEVLVKVELSSVNYKDALAGTGAPGLIRRFPCTAGIDLCGTVAESADPEFKPGDGVLATCCGLGESQDGGYAEYCRVPSAWAVPLPAGLSPFEAMALGTAGFTAALALQRLEHEGLRPGQGPVIVTGATGGVGSLSICLLAQAGYRVTALTGKPDQEGWLKGLGASEVLRRDSLDFSRIKPLGQAVWAGAVDSLGAQALSWLASTMLPGGAIASIGLAAGAAFSATVMPFILRGVSILGINALSVEAAPRRALWRRLAGELKPRALDSIAEPIGFAQLPEAFSRMLAGKVRGRSVVRISGPEASR
ncbi:MAG: acryloyl-CoA reductase [Elusimicrobia bacterium]|jgi:putative YhdH/YhfP family quinone oxidoreductase|nr:acryloyl-CoA reductase [Elusimicrobiota bacterium]